jgi:hypothetical protein
MTGWAITIAYIAGWAVAGVPLGRMATKSIHLDTWKPITAGTAWAGLLLGYLYAFAWPLAAIIWFIRRLFTGGVLDLMKPAAQREREEQDARAKERGELARLREQARALGLPYPGGE